MGGGELSKEAMVKVSRPRLPCQQVLGHPVEEHSKGQLSIQPSLHSLAAAGPYESLQQGVLYPRAGGRKCWQ